MRSMHWQSDELPVALIKVEEQYGNHVDVLFPSSRLAQKSLRLPTCARKLWKIFVLFLAPIGRKDPWTDAFKVFGRIWSSPPSFHHRRNQSRNHVCAWYEGRKTHMSLYSMYLFSIWDRSRAIGRGHPSMCRGDWTERAANDALLSMQRGYAHKPTLPAPGRSHG